MTHSPSHLRWLWRNYLSKHKGLFGIALAAMAVEGSTMGALSWMMRPLFDTAFAPGASRDGALWVGLVVLGIFTIRAFTSVIQKTGFTRLSQQMVGAIRQDLLRHLMRLDGAFFQTNPPGALMQRVEGDVDTVTAIWRSIVAGMGRDLVSVIALFAVAVSVDWRWAAMALVGIPAIVAPSLVLQKFVRKNAHAARDVAGRLSARLNEVVHGIIPVKLNQIETYQQDRYAQLTRQRVRVETRAAIGQATLPGMIDIMAGVGFIGVFVFGGAQIAAGDKTIGDFMAFFTAIGLAFEPLRRLAALSGTWQMAAAGMDRIRDLFAQQPQITAPAHPRPAPQTAAEIRFDGVRLQYSETEVLRGISFTAEAGKTTALVGPSGAGKSSLFNLLTRLVNPSGGQITLGDVPLDAIDLPQLRGAFSVVSQDAALFDDTIGENILFGQTPPPGALDRVLDDAFVSDFLPRLSAGVDTPVGPGGSALSGGQRQRVAIARALMRNTPFLLLDEATSALDTQSEKIVQAALERLAAGRTTLVIAHRLSTVQSADKIVVLDAGKVVEEGTHDTLLAKGGTYARLHQMQFSQSDDA